MPSRHLPLLPVLLASSLLAAGTGFAQEAETEPSSTQPAVAPDAPSRAGVRAFVDPRTGRVTGTPTPEQLEALSALERRASGIRNKSTLGLVATPVAVGGVEVDLAGRFVSSMRALAGPNGLEVVCTDRDDHPPLAHPAAPPPRERSGRGGAVPDLPSADH